MAGANIRVDPFRSPGEDGVAMVNLWREDAPNKKVPMTDDAFEELKASVGVDDHDKLWAAVLAYKQSENADPKAENAQTNRNEAGGPGAEAQKGNP